MSSNAIGLILLSWVSQLPNVPRAAGLLGNLVQSEESVCRSTVAVTATSIVTLASVRTISGIISTATSSASGSTGTPIASAIGPIEVTKLIVPGSLTVPIAIISAVAAPAAMLVAVSAVPVRWAT